MTIWETWTVCACFNLGQPNERRVYVLEDDDEPGKFEFTDSLIVDSDADRNDLEYRTQEQANDLLKRLLDSKPDGLSYAYSGKLTITQQGSGLPFEGEAPASTMTMIVTEETNAPKADSTEAGLRPGG